MCTEGGTYHPFLKFHVRAQRVPDVVLQLLTHGSSGHPMAYSPLINAALPTAFTLLNIDRLRQGIAPRMSLNVIRQALSPTLGLWDTT
jgi:hypothetical protein